MFKNIKLYWIDSVTYLGNKDDPNQGLKTRTRKVIVEAAGGTACIQEDSIDSKICEPCEQGTILLYFSFRCYVYLNYMIS